MKNIFILLIIALTFTACDSFLDVKPTGVLIPKTLEDHDKLMNDFWSIPKGPTNMVFMDPDIYMPGKSYADLAAYGKIEKQKQYTWADDFFTAEQDDEDWNNRYKFIHVVNEIIANVDGAPTGNLAESKRNLVKGEALAHRAMEHFILVNEYAHHYSPSTIDEPGIPLSLKVDLTASLPKSTVGEIYTRILEDLKEADRLMVDAKAFDHKTNFRPRKAAVKALLAIVNLFMNNPEDALSYSNDALELYDFVYDWSKMEHMVEGDPWSGFNYNNGEIERLFSYGTDTRSYLWFKYARHIFTYPVNLYHPDLVALFDKDNDRRWILQSSQTTNTGYDVSPDYAYARGYTKDCNGISVGNLYLINAEAKVRTGDGEGAVDRLNKLREKRFNAPYTPLVHIDNATTLQWVKDERRRELMFTGLNLWDLKRYHAYGETIPTFTRVANGETFTLEPGSSKYVVPIAKKVKAFNPNL